MQLQREKTTLEQQSNCWISRDGFYQGKNGGGGGGGADEMNCLGEEGLDRRTPRGEWSITDQSLKIRNRREGREKKKGLPLLKQNHRGRRNEAGLRFGARKKLNFRKDRCNIRRIATKQTGRQIKRCPPLMTAGERKGGEGTN